MFTQVDHVHVTTTDLDKSIDFYTQVLGFYLSRRIEMNGRQSAYVGLGDVMLELSPPPRGSSEIPPGAVKPFALTVTDMDAALAHLRAHGVEIVEERDAWTFSGRHAAIKDPCGIVIELRQWFAPDGPHNRDWRPARADITRLA
jgi:glyoxylase I family protein